ncbi:hypothetical protein D9M68_504290 [compost metagenome]
MIRREYQTFGFCCGLGGGAKGFKKATANELTLRCVWLMCEAWKDAPAELIVFENVPQLATRGRHLLDQIKQLLAHYGYAVNETTHDCGVIGGLAQSRKRFLMVARHTAKVPAFLYEPPVKRLQGVGAPCWAACRCQATRPAARCTVCRRSSGRRGCGWRSSRLAATGAN